MHGHLSLPMPFPLLLIPLLLHLLHLPLVGSPSAHHSTQQINCRVKLRLANQGDSSRAFGTNSKRDREKEREKAAEYFVIV